jgi:hypothetical protein
VGRDVNDQIIAGAQFDHPYTEAQFREGQFTQTICANVPKCTAEQAEYDALRTAFDGTPAACFFGDQASNTGSSFNFLQVYWQDMSFAADFACQRTKISTGAGSLSASVQELYAQSATMLQQISLPPTLTTPINCSATLPTCAAPTRAPVCTPPGFGCSPACADGLVCEPKLHKCVPTCTGTACK